MIIDPDAEQLIIDFIDTEIRKYGVPANVPVGDRPPQVGEDAGGVPTFVVITRTGGTRRDLVTDMAQMTIDVVSVTNSDALLVLRLIRALLNDLWGKVLAGHAIYSVSELSGPYQNPTDNDPHRYSQTFLIAIRASEVTPA
jgi:hypothetical protein